MTKRKLEATDLFAIQSITNPVISPDGNEAVFIRTEMHKEDNKYYAYLYHVDIKTNEITQWTHSKEKVSSPKWAADGKQLAFLSNRDDKNQIYIMSAKGGEAKQLTKLEKGVSSFIWSPCGKKIWFSASLTEEKAGQTKRKKKIRNYLKHML